MNQPGRPSSKPTPVPAEYAARLHHTAISRVPSQDQRHPPTSGGLRRQRLRRAVAVSRDRRRCRQTCSRRQRRRSTIRPLPPARSTTHLRRRVGRRRRRHPSATAQARTTRGSDRRHVPRPCLDPICSRPSRTARRTRARPTIRLLGDVLSLPCLRLPRLEIGRRAGRSASARPSTRLTYAATRPRRRPSI